MISNDPRKSVASDNDRLKNLTVEEEVIDWTDPGKLFMKMAEEWPIEIG